MTRYRILDLFAGAGGFSYGLDTLDEFETLVATDFNKAALETFSKNIPNAKVIYGDISDINVKKKFSPNLEKTILIWL